MYKVWDLKETVGGTHGRRSWPPERDRVGDAGAGVATASRMHTTSRQLQNARVAESLSMLQEDALVGLMFDDFEANEGQFLDYDKVQKYAVSIQTEFDICDALDSKPVEPEDAWVPSDDWITSMCHAFVDARRLEEEKRRRDAFGGPKREYDPKNPHVRPGVRHKPRPVSPAPKHMAVKAAKLANQRAVARATEGARPKSPKKLLKVDNAEQTPPRSAS